MTSTPSAPEARGSLRSGIFAFYVDQFDIYLPVLVLASVGSYFIPADISATTAAVLSAMVFAVTLVGRPIGAAVFGDLADRQGRKRITVIATTGFGIITLLIAALPGSATIGGWSIGLLIALRFLNGIFLGGAYTSAVPLAMEWSAPQRRGQVAGQLLSTSPAAYATLGLLTVLLSTVMPSPSAYAQTGWRIPFVVGAVLAFSAAAMYQRSAREPHIRRAQAGGRRRPLGDLFFGSNRRALLQVLVLMTGVWLANNMVSAVLPQLLGRRVGLSPRWVAAVSTVNAVALIIAFQVGGALSQRTGRRRFYLVYGAAMATLGASLYATLMITTPGSLAVVTALAVGTAVATNASFGPIAAYLTERFPARMRASGFGVGYSLALVLPAFYSFYLAWLERALPPYLAPVVLVVLAGALVSIAAFLGPETKNVDLNH